MGDGIRMACALGAGVRDMGFIKGTFDITRMRARRKGGTGPNCPYRGGIAVNQRGKRYVDESKSHVARRRGAEQPGATAYQVFDQNIMDGASDGAAVRFQEHAAARSRV
jgi:fumarate reductase flavoprotein subunit